VQEAAGGLGAMLRCLPLASAAPSGPRGKQLRSQDDAAEFAGQVLQRQVMRGVAGDRQLSSLAGDAFRWAVWPGRF
jgi:hypothetical protein